jgi:CheY-like chemotaxis protein
MYVILSIVVISIYLFLFIFILSALWKQAAIKAAPQDASEPVNALPGRGCVRITVADTGAGLSAHQLGALGGEQHVQVAASGKQADNGGCLGLWISRKIVELHHGTMTVTSEGLGCGTVVTVEIPVFKSETVKFSPARGLLHGNLYGQNNFALNMSSDLISYNLRNKRADQRNDTDSNSLAGASIVKSSPRATGDKDILAPADLSCAESVAHASLGSDASSNTVIARARCNSKAHRQIAPFPLETPQTAQARHSEAPAAVVMDPSEERKVTNILLVDDVASTRKIVRRILTKAGYECKEAENGEECLSMVTSDASFDLILMDYEMPVMNGEIDVFCYFCMHAP